MGKNGDLKNYTYELLKSRLINCAYMPGSILNETQLSIELGLSRTPVREALYRLEQDGLVRIAPKIGIYVTDITLQDVMKVFQVRVEVEPLALMMAAPFLGIEDLTRFRAMFGYDEPDVDKAFWQDIEMHSYFVQRCGNPFIIDMMSKVYGQGCRIVIASKQNHLKISSARKEHEAILDALLSEQYDAAAELLRLHLIHCKDYSLSYFSNLQAQTSGSANPLYHCKRKDA